MANTPMKAENAVADVRAPTESERTAAAEKARTDAKVKQDDVAKAKAEAGKLAAKAAEDRAKAEAAKETPEHKAARESAQKADDAAAKAAEAERAARASIRPMTTAEAKVAAPVDPAMPASHHMAQKFGNDPANPKHATGVSDDPKLATVRLSRKTPDHSDLIHASCHPDMVGDFLRAGWNLDDVQAGAYVSKEEHAEADKAARVAAG